MKQTIARLVVERSPDSVTAMQEAERRSIFKEQNWGQEMTVFTFADESRLKISGYEYVELESANRDGAA